MTSLRKEREARTSNEAVWQLEIEQLRRHLLQLQHQKSTTSNTTTCISTLSPSTTAPATAIGRNIRPVSSIYQPHPSHTHTITSTPLPLPPLVQEKYQVLLSSGPTLVRGDQLTHSSQRHFSGCLLGIRNRTSE